MALKLSARQQAQVAFLERQPVRIQKVGAIIEQLAANQADEPTVRQMIRILDEMKSGASQLSMNGLSDAAGQMAAMGRRGGGQQVKVRGLRDMLGSLKNHFDSAMKKAVVPEGEEEAAE
jgi:hypothetical protein